MSDELIKHYEFPTRQVLEESGYHVFPKELEDDDLVFFHATAAKNVEGILQFGLQPGVKVGKQLHSISYAERSVGALNHWIDVREGREGVILALRFADREELWLDAGTYYSGELKYQPLVIATCPVPSIYRHV
jgi:hypothetical protein